MGYVTDTKVHAAQLRKDIKARIAAGEFGELPEGFRVRVVSSASNISIGLDCASSEWLWSYGWDDLHGMFAWSYTPRAMEILNAIEVMRAAGQVCLSTDTTPYHQHQLNYYGHTDWAWVARPLQPTQ